MEIDSISRGPEGILQHDVEIDAKRGWASIQPCFTPLFTSNGVDDDPLNWTIPFIPKWKDCKVLRSLFRRYSLKRTSRLTKSKALVRSIKATNTGCFCSLHFS